MEVEVEEGVEEAVVAMEEEEEEVVVEVVVEMAHAGTYMCC